MSDNGPAAYFATRLSYDRRRSILWQTLVRHVFQPYVPIGGSVLELGAGYCDFINTIVADVKYAVDMWPGMSDYAEPDVVTIIGDVLKIVDLRDESVDVIFASNFFEHLTKDELTACLQVVKKKLKSGGLLISLQPNYRYAFREYFDDYTHVSIWSHKSLPDFFVGHGFTIEKIQPRFLPLTIKSTLPVKSFLIRAYLASPIKPLAKQMLLVARNSRK